ncbi:MAG: hypothetical protein ABIK92_18070 [Pseudomonadota bacterium]
MAKEILVTELLSEQMVSAGADLLKKLDDSSCRVKAAFWMFLPEEKTWKFILASPLVKEEGPRKYYKRIVDASKDTGTEDNIISLNDISVLSVDDQLIQLLKFAISTGESISNIRFSKNTINGVFIDDTHIYRMNVNT